MGLKEQLCPRERWVLSTDQQQGYCVWLAGRRETPSQHAPAARAGQR